MHDDRVGGGVVVVVVSNGVGMIGRWVRWRWRVNSCTFMVVLCARARGFVSRILEIRCTRVRATRMHPPPPPFIIIIIVIIIMYRGIVRAVETSGNRCVDRWWAGERRSKRLPTTEQKTVTGGRCCRVRACTAVAPSYYSLLLCLLLWRDGSNGSWVAWCVQPRVK